MFKQYINSILLQLVLLLCITINSNVAFAAINDNAPITVTFQNTEIQDALKTIASMGQAQIIVDTNVSGKITAQFKNTPFKEVIESTLIQAGLASQRTKDSIYVGMPGQLPDINAEPSIDRSSLQPLLIKLKYIKADQIKSVISAIIPEDRIRVENVNNALILIGNDDEYGKVQELISQLDMPPQQVMFEAEVVELSKNGLNQFGVNWEWSSFPGASGSELLGVIKVGPNQNINYRGTLNALVTSEKAKILANPRIGVLDGQTARILIGDRLPVETKYLANGVQQVTVNYVDVGIKLEVTPWINEEGIITTKLRPEVSTNIATNGNNPSIRTREAETTLRVRNGETIVLGGLIQKENRVTVSKLPLLGNLPVIGHFFKTTSNDKRETELVIFITPKIMNNP